MNTIEAFVDQIVKEKGFDKEAPEVVAQITQDLLESIDRRVTAMIVTTLDPGVLEEFEAILDVADDAKTQSFVKMHIPDIDERVAAELLAFKTTYLG